MKVTNIVAKAKTRQVDLDDVFIYLSAKKVGVKMPQKFPALFVKLSVFGTGTITLNGIKSLEELSMASVEMKALFQEYGLQFTEPKVVNVVATFEAGRKVNLHQLLEKIKSTAFLNLELSNNLEIRFGTSGRVLLHPTGNGIISGAASIDDANQIWDNITKIVCS